MKKSYLVLLTLVIAIGITVGGCSLNKEGQTVKKINNPDFVIDNKTVDENGELADKEVMQKFNSREEILTFLDENRVASQIQNNGMYDYGVVEERMMPMASMESIDQAVGDSQALNSVKKEASSDYSETNVQVAGIDEADIVKTNGKGVFVLSKENIFLLKAYPASETEVMSVIKLDNYARNLYLQDDYLIVFGSDSSIYTKRSSLSFVPRSSYTFLKVFDISDLSKPVLVKDWKFQGNYSDSRLTSGKLYLITNYHNYSGYNNVDDFLPQILEDNKEVAIFCEKGKNCLMPDIYYLPTPYDNYNYTNIFTVDLKASELSMDMDSFLLDQANNIYMSYDNLYLSYIKYLDHNQIKQETERDLVFPYLSLEDREKISTIEAVDSFILTEAEKQAKINRIIYSYLASLSEEEQERWQENILAALKDKYKDLADSWEQTIIHKIAVKDSGLEPTSQGAVSGRALNQFSMDEHNGYFRIATTNSGNNYPWYLRNEGGFEREESDNRVYILDANLETVGQIKDLAKGERIYSARFMGDKGYLVTFKQVDPLFALDLSNPTNPKVLGELKIPGFSEYLHPYDEDIIIGFGKDTYVDENERVRVKGLKLSLFDVSNPSALKELDTYIAGDSGSYSYVLDDHKALLFSKEKNLLVLPVRINEPGESYYERFNGALVFSIVDKKFNLRGEIDHQDLGSNNYDNQVKRSLYIENNLYTVSDNYIKINSLSDLKELKTVNLSTFLKDYEIISREEN